MKLCNLVCMEDQAWRGSDAWVKWKDDSSILGKVGKQIQYLLKLPNAGEIGIKQNLPPNKFPSMQNNWGKNYLSNSPISPTRGGN